MHENDEIHSIAQEPQITAQLKHVGSTILFYATIISGTFYKFPPPSRRPIETESVFLWRISTWCLMSWHPGPCSYSSMYSDIRWKSAGRFCSIHYMYACSIVTKFQILMTRNINHITATAWFKLLQHACRTRKHVLIIGLLRLPLCSQPLQLHMSWCCQSCELQLSRLATAQDFQSGERITAKVAIYLFQRWIGLLSRLIAWSTYIVQ